MLPQTPPPRVRSTSHPTRCGEFDDPEKGASPEAYEAALKALVEGAPGSVIAVGEAGLDYDRLGASESL